jgi:hypothetical protein
MSRSGQNLITRLTAVASGPAMFETAQLDRAGGVDGSDPDPIAALGRRPPHYTSPAMENENEHRWPHRPILKDPGLSALRELLSPSRLTHVVDVGANPIDGQPPYKPMLTQGLCRVTGFEPQRDALLEL